MRRTTATLVTLAACLVTAPTALAREVTVRSGDDGRTIVLKRGDTLRVSLQENPSTGYGWRTATAPARAVLRLRSNRFVAPAQTSPPIAGAPGRRVVTYRAVGRGTTALRLRLVGPDGSADEAFRLRVRVT